MTDVANIEPIADAGRNRSARPNVAVTFDASSSIDPDGKIVEYSWRFLGDGSAVAKGVTVEHTFTAEGTFPTVLTVLDDGGSIGTDTITVNVDELNPIADFSVSPSTELTTGDVVSFDASASASQTQITAYTWTFGNGAVGSGQQTTYAYEYPGTFKVTMEVTDANDRKSHKAVWLTIMPGVDPIAEFTVTPPSGSIDPGQVVSFDASASSSPGRIVAWSWTFGDSNRGSGLQTTHAYDFDGSFEVTLLVTDDNNRTNESSIWLEVLPGPSTTLTIQDIQGDYTWIPDVTARSCQSYNVAFTDTSLSLSAGAPDPTCNSNTPVAAIAGPSGTAYLGCFDGTTVTVTSGPTVVEPGGGCLTSLTMELRAVFDGPGHFTGTRSSFYDASLGCQCSAIFQMEGTRQ